jgi:hypothetical protein
VLNAEAVEPFRRGVRQELGNWMRQNFPSLKATDKPEPA